MCKTFIMFVKRSISIANLRNILYTIYTYTCMYVLEYKINFNQKCFHGNKMLYKVSTLITLLIKVFIMIYRMTIKTKEHISVKLIFFYM